MAKAKQEVAVRAARKDVTTAKPSARALAVPAGDFESELLADSGKGFEEAGREAFAIPFLRVLQDLSPQVKKKMAGYIEGAQPGQILNTVSQQLYSDVRVVPCYFSQSYIEWTPRDKGGGLVAVHPATTPLVRQAVRSGSKNVLPNGNELMDTRSHFVLLVHDDGATEGALIAMSSTSLKVSRRWMSQMLTATVQVGEQLVKPPMFAWSYKLTTEEEANDYGSWYQWTVSDRERVQDVNVYRAAKAFGESMAAGNVKVNYSDLQHEAPASGAVTGGGTPRDLDDEIDA